mmetsp:Transcript_46716/g.69080  ORF Transcript_46716/g.69080 Transcript_46716/m.69080 type:complete len:260 (+) Transcript_46716:24-803(+)
MCGSRHQAVVTRRLEAACSTLFLECSAISSETVRPRAGVRWCMSWYTSIARNTNCLALSCSSADRSFQSVLASSTWRDWYWTWRVSAVSSTNSLLHRVLFSICSTTAEHTIFVLTKFSYCSLAGSSRKLMLAMSNFLPFTTFMRGSNVPSGSLLGARQLSCSREATRMSYSVISLSKKSAFLELGAPPIVHKLPNRQGRLEPGQADALVRVWHKAVKHDGTVSKEVADPYTTPAVDVQFIRHNISATYLLVNAPLQQLK